MLDILGWFKDCSAVGLKDDVQMLSRYPRQNSSFNLSYFRKKTLLVLEEICAKFEIQNVWMVSDCGEFSGVSTNNWLLESEDSRSSTFWDPSGCFL